MAFAITLEQISELQAQKIITMSEGQYSDVKAIEIAPAKLTNLLSAFANADGGDLYIGIDEQKIGDSVHRNWRGFVDQEAANGHLQCFEEFFPLGSDFQYQFLECAAHSGLVLHAQVSRTRGIKKSSNQTVYVRRGAMSHPVVTSEDLKRLEYAKGLVTFETEVVQTAVEAIIASDITKQFIEDVVPTSEPEAWLRKQGLIINGQPTVAGLLLFSDEPQAFLPKRCGIKIARYKTTEGEGFRAALEFTPRTVEGCLYFQIKDAVEQTKEITESIPKLGQTHLQNITYPPETLHEILTNAVIHRDYSVADDVHIRIFDDRIEVQSPGTLPAHVTTKNILEERYARNGAIVRILNKFRDPPNQDIGEGLNTAFAAMTNIGLKAPQIFERENSVLVIIRHERLASPENTILEYLAKHPSINNRQARELTHIRRDHQMKAVFVRMVKSDMIEVVPGSKTSKTAYRTKQVAEEVNDTNSCQRSLFGMEVQSDE